MTNDPEITRLRAIYTNRGLTGPGQRWDPRRSENRCMLEERAAATHELLRRAQCYPLCQLDILEIGCGDGENLAMLLREGADPQRLHGIDLIEQAVNAARARLAGVDLRVADARTFSLGPASIDLVILHTVFSSTLDDAVIEAVIARISDMLRPGGLVLWYDFFIKNPLNPHTRPMRKAHIRRFFAGFEIELRRITLLPPLARRLGRHTASLYPLLAPLPFLNGHYLGLFRRHGIEACVPGTQRSHKSCRLHSRCEPIDGRPLTRMPWAGAR